MSRADCVVGWIGAAGGFGLSVVLAFYVVHPEVAEISTEGRPVLAVFSVAFFAWSVAWLFIRREDRSV